MEYAKVLAGKKKAYAEYRKVWPEMQNYQIALKVAGACVGDENEQESILERRGPASDAESQKIV